MRFHHSQGDSVFPFFAMLPIFFPKPLTEHWQQDRWCIPLISLFNEMSMFRAIISAKVARVKGISEMKSKQQSPCSNCMHWPLMPWGNACSTCMHKPVRCMHLPVPQVMHPLTEWDLKFQVCLGYTFTAATLHFCHFLSIFTWFKKSNLTL